MKRIMVVGCCGAGKSTLAREISRITGLQLIHLDQLFWLPDWTEPDKQEWTETVRSAAAADYWVIDGNYSSSLDIRLERADTVVFLDRSRWTCLLRVLKRNFTYLGRTRWDMADGCRERLSWQFLVYVFHFNDTRRPVLLRKLRDLAGDREVVILRSDRQTQTWLERLRVRFGKEAI